MKVLLLFVVAILMTGCSALFDFNAFASLDKPSAPSVSDIKSGGLTTLATDLSSPAVVAALAADATTTGEIKDYLITDYHVTTGPLISPDQQNAAALYADLCLKTTSGDQLVNNVVDTMVNLSQTPTSTLDLSTLFADIVPADVASDPTKFGDMVQGFLDAEKAYEALGTSIDPSSAGVLGSMNLGDTAQKAAVAYLIDSVVSSSSEEDLYNLVNNKPNNVPADFANPFDSSPAWLQNIVTASGAPLPV